MSIVSSLCWVGRKKFATFPIKEDEDELLEKEEEMYQELEEEEKEEREEKMEAEESKNSEQKEMTEEEKAQKAKRDQEIADTIKEFGMENYDDEDDVPIDMKPYYEDNAEDPNIDQNDQDDDDVENETILPTDLFILANVTDIADDFSHLDVNVFEEAEDNLYIHHDYMLPAAPLAIQWIGYNVERKCIPGNVVAIATFEPGIEIWNLDVINAMEPVCVLGGFASKVAAAEKVGGIRRKGKGKKGKKATQMLADGSHHDAVLTLSWNKNQPNILASGSADGTVKIWDLSTRKCVSTLTHHSDKVQSIAWHPTEKNILLTAAFDKTVCVVDVSKNAVLRTFHLEDDPEMVNWNPLSLQQCVVSTERGELIFFDVLDSSKDTPKWTLAAHSKPLTSFSFCPKVKGLLATGSTDKTIKLWFVSDKGIKNVHSRMFDTEIFTVAFDEEAGTNLAFGGDSVALWDVGTIQSVKYIYENKIDNIVPTKDAIEPEAKHKKKLGKVVKSFKK